MCPSVQVVHKGVFLSSALKYFVEEDSAQVQGAEDVQEERPKPLTEVMVTYKQEPMAAERGCPEPLCGLIDFYQSFGTDTLPESCSMATETHFPVGSKPL